MNSIIYNLNGNDKTLILGTRSRLLQSFKALNWTDLRLAIALSITKPSDPNDHTGLDESLGTGEEGNQVYIGFKSSNSLFPASTNFWGVSTLNPSVNTSPNVLGDSSQGYYIFSQNVTDVDYASNGTTHQKISPASCPRLQNGSGILSGYATVVLMRMLRNDPTINLVDALQVSTNDSFWDTGLPFLTDTSTANLRAIAAAATYTTLIGPFAFTAVPDALFFYWPFNNSRLRIHNYVLEKYG